MFVGFLKYAGTPLGLRPNEQGRQQPWACWWTVLVKSIYFHFHFKNCIRHAMSDEALLGSTETTSSRVHCVFFVAFITLTCSCLYTLSAADICYFVHRIACLLRNSFPHLLRLPITWPLPSPRGGTRCRPAMQKKWVSDPNRALFGGLIWILEEKECVSLPKIMSTNMNT